MRIYLSLFRPFYKKSVTPQTEKIITLSFIAAATLTGLLSLAKIYTSTTFILLAALLVFAKFVAKVNWLAKFYVIYGVLLFPFLIVNGLLTGTGLAAPVVWYNSNEIFGLRILTIPIEDVFYGMDLILMNLLLFLRLKKVG